MTLLHIRNGKPFSTMAGVGVLLTLLSCGCRKEPISAPPSTQKAPASEPRVVTVAAAADLQYALSRVVGEFEKKNPGTQVKATYGSSGNFYTQLSNHAPFDVFFSADVDYPRKLIAAGLASKESEFKYAVGTIVVWVPNDSPLDVKRLGSETLTQPTVRKVAIANPAHAPYGRAAEAALKKLEIYDRIKDHLVLGENIAQTAQFVESGSADVGVIALSLAMSPAMRDKGRYWEIPIDSYPPLEQAGIILNWAKDLEAAKQFKAFVTGTDGRAILKEYGFTVAAD